MKQLSAFFTAIALTSISLAGCGRTPEEQAKYEADMREKQLAEAEKARIQAEEEAKVCRINVNLRQNRFSLDLWDHVKDEMNAANFPLPTSCDRVASLQVGDNLVDEFRVGSFLISGTLGNWNLSVNDIPYTSHEADTTSCKVKMELSQSHFTLDLTQHIKDEMNKVAFEWDMPGNVYNEAEVGQDFARDGFRIGSLLLRGSFGDWNLKLVEKMGCAP